MYLYVRQSDIVVIAQYEIGRYKADKTKLVQWSLFNNTTDHDKTTSHHVIAIIVIIPNPLMFFHLRFKAC